MNRTLEFYQSVDKESQKNETTPKEKFYDTLNIKIDKLISKASKCKSYKDSLILEEEYRTASDEINQTLDVISINGTKDEVKHFEGIKRIIELKLQALNGRLKQLKRDKMGMNIELEPEQPQKFTEMEQVTMMEEENKKLLSSYMLEGYKMTRKRLQEVEVLQDTIFQHLSVQDERIDDVLSETGKASKHMENTSDVMGRLKNTGRFFKRVLLLLILCLTFVLVFLHLYNRY